MPDPASHHPVMFTVKGNTLPRLWWLKPWSTAQTLSSIVAALKTQNDRLDLALRKAEDSRLHWVAKAERAHAVALHNERVIREMEERPRG
jgi:hypothetical protein